MNMSALSILNIMSIRAVTIPAGMASATVRAGATRACWLPSKIVTSCWLEAWVRALIRPYKRPTLSPSRQSLSWLKKLSRLTFPANSSIGRNDDISVHEAYLQVFIACGVYTAPPAPYRPHPQPD